MANTKKDQVTEQQEPTIEEMTTHTIGESLMQLVIQEFKAMPDVWQKMPEAKQRDVIDRARENVSKAVKNAVRLIASEGKPIISGVVEQVNAKAGLELKIKVAGCSSENKLALIEHAGGGTCLIVLADAAANMGNMNIIKPEKDQPELLEE
ncbi:hypothetical protein DM558_00300 [Entomomonas moraniae]|uniref:Uncharacterized protein n=1 Tax=Entomomonas moraniae TaxID=2213226 RepID=A0A3Q9JGZ4_9GAMM|nr:hypothetical protein [Entomomonas moraniae]AZS49310.1 hypothetical protein DM558_00300 [Entomomonas moraniae]